MLDTGRVSLFWRTAPLGGCFYVILFYVYNIERIEIMKKTITSALSLILCLTCLFCLYGCQSVPKEGLWEDAVYRRDTTLGKGDKTVLVEVKAGDESITFTINTDKDTLGDALLEHELIEGEQGAYGLYIKKVNGILADYDVDKSYWGFYQDGEYMMTGVDGTAIEGGEHFELVYEQ